MRLFSQRLFAPSMAKMERLKRIPGADTIKTGNCEMPPTVQTNSSQSQHLGSNLRFYFTNVYKMKISQILSLQLRHGYVRKFEMWQSVYQTIFSFNAIILEANS